VSGTLTGGRQGAQRKRSDARAPHSLLPGACQHLPHLFRIHLECAINTSNERNMAAQATAFQLVLEKFKLQLSDKEKRQFAATTIDDLHVAIETIQRKQLSDKKLRAMSKLERFLEGMKEYDKVVSVFLNTSAILAFVWV
jgi:hypothetical protein